MNNPRPNPYIGPRAFKTGEVLYGREREINELFDLLIAERIIVLHSPSGAGKSSLLHAGMVPRLIEEGFHVLPVIRVSQERPLDLLKGDDTTGLVRQFNRYVFSTLLSLEEDLPAEKRTDLVHLARANLDAYIETIVLRKQAANQINDKTSYVIIFDQFEEILTIDPNDRETKSAFFQQLGAALRNKNLWALIAIREDYLPALEPYSRSLPTRLANTFRLDLLGAAAACDAIELPAKFSEPSVIYTQDSVTKLVDDLRRIQVQQPDGSMQEQPGLYVEPVQLQVVCYRLWQNLAPDDIEIDANDLANIGDVNQSLANYYASWAVEIAKETNIPERKIRGWFENQLITESGIRSQVLMQPETSNGLDNRAIWKLVDAHLVRAEKRRNATWFELAHDRLIRPVRQNNAIWFDANLSLLQRQAELWERSKRSESLLFGGQTLAEAQKWATEHASESGIIENEFLAASFESEKRSKEMQQLEIDRQRAEEKARSAARLRQLLIIAVAAAIFAIIFAAFAINQRQNAEFQSALAKTNAVEANQARATEVQLRQTSDYNADVAAKNASKAVAARDAEATQKSIADNNRLTAESAQSTAEKLAAVAQAEATAQVPIASSRLLSAQAFSYLETQPDLSALLGIEAYYSAPTWESLNYLYTRVQRDTGLITKPYGGSFPQQRFPINRVVFSPDGKKIVWGSDDGSVSLYDRDQDKTISRTRHTQQIASVAFSKDGKTIATAGYDKKIYLWDIDQFSNPSYLPDELPNRIGGLALSLDFSPDGKRLAAGLGAYFTIYDLATKEVTKEFKPPKSYSEYVYNIAWSPNGRWVAASDVNGTLIVWDPVTGQRYKTPSGILPDGGVYSLAWSPDSKFLVAGDEKGNVILYDIETGNAVGSATHEKRKSINALSFSRNGKILASGGNDEEIMFWEVPTLKPADSLEMKYKVYSLDFTRSDGPNLLVSAGTESGRDGMLELFEILPASPLYHQEDQMPADLHDVSAITSDKLVQSVLMNKEYSFSELPNSFRELDTPFAINLNRKWIVSAGKDNTIQVYDGNEKEVRNQFQTQNAIEALAISSDGHYLAASQCLIATTSRSPECDTSLLSIWNLDNQTVSLPMTEIQTKGGFNALTFYPGTDRLVGGRFNGGIYEWDIHSGHLNRTSSARFPGQIKLLLFSPNGKILASAGNNSQLAFWDTANFQPIGQPLENPVGQNTSFSFNNDGTRLYTGSFDRSIVSWNLNPNDWVNRVCTLAGRNLNQDELSNFLPSKSEGYVTCP